ncbi:MAG TPA: DUF222 domain-containing protein [Intrasporangium sp.]|uniref:HNH endonuclease signature motif containing protein n=1 Tax=Intrasporangium sp. TaxID=1925024 RepID=UPI002D785724|nr:DUF222 domain-containing protein [Intrasporangium sp.]HET7399167.1 DUF222 domain-containing protein [Intrasporangium sp.]
MSTAPHISRRPAAGRRAPGDASGAEDKPRAADAPSAAATDAPSAAATDHPSAAATDQANGEPPEPHAVAALLAAMARTVRLLARDYPTWSLPEGAVGEVIAQAQVLREMAHSLTAVLAGEADGRGLGSEDGLSRPDWVRSHAPGLDGGQASTVTKVGAAMSEPRWARLAEKVRDGRVTVAQAAVLVRFHEDVQTIADPEQLAGIVEAMVDTVEVFTVRELTRLTDHARTSLKPPRELDAQDAGRRLGRAFSRVGRSAGMSEYRLRLDPEGAAIIDAAIDPLSRPRPDLGWDGVDRDDPRSPATRRADALLELVGRAVAAPEGMPRTERAKLVVTMSVEALLGQLRGAGVAKNDEVLSPSTVRRLACDAGIIPVVLAGPSEVLDVGHEERFFTPAQRRALAIRDRGCTFPGCTIPPQWCESHHVKHWLHGGPTDLLNAALLCARHHTVVHVRGLVATVTSTGVTWHV